MSSMPALTTIDGSDFRFVMFLNSGPFFLSKKCQAKVIGLCVFLYITFEPPELEGDHA